MTGGEDPDNRRTYPWADLGGHPDKTMLAEFQQFQTLRKNISILAKGTLSAPLFADAHLTDRMAERIAASPDNLDQRGKTVAPPNDARLSLLERRFSDDIIRSLSRI